MRPSIWLTLLGVLLIATMAPMASAAAPTSYLTTGFVASHSGQVTENGVVGVNITYTNAFSSSAFAFVYVDVVNSAGQTLLAQGTGSTYSAGQSASTFVGLVGLAHGTYTATLFAATGGVPISTVTHVQVTI